MHDLNDAIAVYVGHGVISYPNEDAARVVNRFGKPRGQELVESVRSLLSELDAIKPTWDKNDLATTSRLAVDQLALRHPGLNNEAKAALAWIYSWWWK